MHTFKHNELIDFFFYNIYANFVGFHTLVPVIHVVIQSRKGIFIQILLKSANRFMRYPDKRFFFFFFCLKFSSFSAGVTLEIRSRSPKPIQLFIKSQYYSIYMQIWLKSATGASDIMHTSNFGHKFSRLSSGVTLKIR